MSVERINSQLKKVREQIAQLQAKEKDLAEQKQMAEDAEAMKIIRKYKISSERLQDRKSTRLNSSHKVQSRMPSSA